MNNTFNANSERSACEFIESYKGWDILFSIPNGGILAVVLIQGDLVFQFPVLPGMHRFSFDFSDHDGLLAHAKKAIDSPVFAGVFTL